MKYIKTLLLMILLLGQHLYAQQDTILIDSILDKLHNSPTTEVNYEEAKSILALSKKLDYGKGINEAYFIIAYYYNAKKDYLKAISIFHKMLENGNIHQKQSFVVDAYFGLAHAYSRLELEKEADEYFSKVLQFSKEIKDTNLLAHTYSDIGLFYLEKGDYENAISYLNQSKAISQEVDSILSFSIINLNLGIAYVEMGQTNLGLTYFYNYLDVIKEEKDSIHLADAYTNIAWALKEQNLLDKSLMYYDSALYHAQLENLAESTFIIYADISAVYTKKKDYRKALEYFEDYHTLKDSVINFRTKKQGNELKIKYETAKKENEIIAKEKLLNELNIEKQQMWLIIGGLISSLLIISLLILKTKSDARHQQKLQNINEKLIRSELEKKEILNQQLQNELKNKEVDLTNFALDIGRKNEFSTTLNEKLLTLQKTDTKNIKPQLKEIIFLLNDHLSINEDLTLLQENISNINQSFYKKLDAKFDKLTTNDKYILGLIRLNLSNKDIAKIKGISPDSAKVVRYRLRKKLNLTPDIDIVQFLKNI